MPSPVSRMAPKPRRLTESSPPRETVPAKLAEISLLFMRTPRNYSFHIFALITRAIPNLDSKWSRCVLFDEILALQVRPNSAGILACIEVSLVSLREAISSNLPGRPSVALVSRFRDLHKSLLNKLCRSRHSIRVDLDASQQIRIPPVVNLGRCSTQLNLNTAFH
jgi:hypothetical protein